MLDILREKIKASKNNCISYAEYMETALYHPVKGYYMKEKQKLGKGGDFYTSMHVHDVFAKMFAKLFAKFFALTDMPPVICEAGGGDGRFAHAVITAWEEQSSKPLTYCIIETSPYHRKLQEAQLKCFQHVHIYASLEEAKTDKRVLNGVFFSNELFDALPVHVVQKVNGELNEVFVTLEDEQLKEVMIPCTNQQILNWIAKHLFELEEGQRLEIPLMMKEIMQDYAEWFDEVLILTVDYGYLTEEWKHPARRKGSLRGYYQHQQIEDLLQYPGEMDMTTHVHFDALIDIGVEEQLEMLGMMSQAEFLLKAGILYELQAHQDPNPFSEVSRRNRAIRSFITSDGMGSAFHVVMQKKGLPFLKVEDLLEVGEQWR
ncbi:SAM-dependent methyltransferase [Bacillus tianshenii]|nr:SAM-dependent methyltransferase [Bacillus tianshenii]